MNIQRDQGRAYWIVVHAIATIVFLAIHFLAKAGLLDFIENNIIKDTSRLLEKWTVTLAIVAIILMTRSILEKIIWKLNQSQGEKYNLSRITRLLANTIVVYVVLASFFVDPYNSLASLGIASLILGFALQAPISSFIAWLYIVFRSPYQVGDRIQIHGKKGDVIEINYLDTIIEEFSGDYLQNDFKSGRIIYFPNSKILTDQVVNYSGPIRPYIWDETAVQIAFTSDLEFVEECFLKVAQEDFQDEYATLYYGPENEVKPAVYYRVNERAWLEAVISYPVKPLDTTGKRNRLLRKALPLLNAEPEKVQFPEGTLR
ncbi:MAG TPA: mechanosensitive ion channel domain-containing protein [Flavobacteriaceae bacterium]|nr:mechanosensitive ion channel domain-containing protein [Flavobacteriaceae bacterium]